VRVSRAIPTSSRPELNLNPIGVALAALSLCGCAYLAVALAAVTRARGRSIPQTQHAPPITILKPLHGLEVELFENLCSFCDQEYDRFQVIFCARPGDDAAIDVARRVIERYPARDLTLVIDDAARAGNPKMAKVAAMLPHAKYALLAIADADMRVRPGYLRALAAEFDDERVGAVTALYSGSPRGGIASVLGAMHINDQFAPSVLVAATLGPIQFTFGSTMAVRREVLDAIGGVDALANHLADDYVLGALVYGIGRGVALSRFVVSNIVFERDLTTLWHHELRWARIIRAQRPLGYAGSVVTFPLPFALALLLVPGYTLAGAVLTMLALSLRLVLHREMQRLFADPAPHSAMLLPLRDVLGLAIWAGSYFGHGVRWRGAEFPVKG
jgi:ceramide glucosyltransferase